MVDIRRKRFCCDALQIAFCAQSMMQGEAKPGADSGNAAARTRMAARDDISAVQGQLTFAGSSSAFGKFERRLLVVS
jgi:hypothetical protein